MFTYQKILVLSFSISFDKCKTRPLYRDDKLVIDLIIIFCRYFCNLYHKGTV